MRWSDLTVEQREQLISERVPKKWRDYPLYCHDLVEAGLWTSKGCCDSCHEDHQMYGFDLDLVFLPDGRELECCCGLSIWIHEATQGYITAPIWMLDLEKSLG